MLELSSRGGELREARLTMDISPDQSVSETISLPEGMREKCLDWYDHLEAWWVIEGEQGLGWWRKKHDELALEMRDVMHAVLLPGEFGRRVQQEAERAAGGLLLIGISAEDDQLDYLPLELLGHPRENDETRIVVWRCRAAPARRKPVLRLLAVRSAPRDVSLPQNEDQVTAIGAYLAPGEGPRIETDVLGNSTYEELAVAVRDFVPGVIHLVTHGTRTAFQFDSPPSHDLVEYGAFARYLGRIPSVTTVVSTACFSAQPPARGEDRAVCFASRVIELGVSAAVGMATKITPNAAQRFTEALYGELARARPITEAYAEAVLALRDMKEDDHLLWSVPVMYAKNSNVIPFPNRGYFDLLDRLEGLLEGIEGLRTQLAALSTISRGERIAEAGGLELDMAAIRDYFSDIADMEIAREPNAPGWPEKFRAASTRLDRLMRQVASAARQGETAEQLSSVLRITLDEIRDLVNAEFPIAAES